MKYPNYTAEDLRKDIIQKMLAVPVLGKNYIDYHTDDSVCGLELKMGDDTYDILITKRCD